MPYSELFEKVIREGSKEPFSSLFKQILREAEKFVFPQDVAKAGRSLSRRNYKNAEYDTKQELWKKGELSIIITLPGAKDKNGDPISFRMRFTVDKDENGNPLTFKDVDQSVSINEAANKAKEFMDEVCSNLENTFDDANNTAEIPYPRNDNIWKNQYADGAKTEILKQYGKVDPNKTPEDIAGTISSMGTHLPKDPGVRRKKKSQ